LLFNRLARQKRGGRLYSGFTSVLVTDIHYSDPGAGGRLAVIGCVYWRPAPIGATG
jgi:hypothetical protein